MNCTKCGKEIPEGENKLCDECKNSLLTDIGSEEEHKFEINKNQKVSDVPKKKSKKGLIAFIILVIVVACLAVFEWKTSMIRNLFVGDNKVGITIGNNNNNVGCANIQKDWIYYMTLSEDGMEIALNKIKTDGTEHKKLVEKDWEIYSINVVGDYIYFIAFEPSDDIDESSYASSYQNNKIYRITTDGEDLTVINDNEFSPEFTSMYVIKDKVYYIGEDYNIYSMDTNGENKTKINDNGTGFIGVTDKYILYNDYRDGSEDEADIITYAMNLDGTEQREINGKRLYNPNMIGDIIYYVDGDTSEIFKVNIDGTGDEKIYSSKAYNMNVSGDYIYYLNYENEEEENVDDAVCIHKVKTDGTDHQIIIKMENYTSFINIVGDWIYYTDHSDNNYFINLIKTDGSETINLYKYDYNGPASTQTVEEDDIDDDSDSTNTSTSTNTVENVTTTETSTNTTQENTNKDSNTSSNVNTTNSNTENNNTANNNTSNNNASSNNTTNNNTTSKGNTSSN